MMVTICILTRVLQQMKMSLNTIHIFMWNKHISPPNPLVVIVGEEEGEGEEKV